MEVSDIKAGQVWNMNRVNMEGYTLHVLGVFVDLKGKYKIAVQMEYPRRSKHRAPNLASARLVIPQYFFGMTVQVKG